MAIFGYFNHTMAKDNTTVEHAATALDSWFNYIFGVSFILLFLISTTLNPLSLLYHHSLKFSNATLFYQLLAGSDFLTNMVRPLVVSYNLLKPGLDEVYTVDVDISVLNNLLTISAFTLRNASSMVVAIMCLTRYIAIKKPFYRIRRNILLVCMGLFISTDLVYYTLIVFIMPYYRIWSRYNQQLLVLQEDNMFVIQFYFAWATMQYGWTFLGVVFSCLTVWELLRNGSAVGTSRERERRGCLNIFIMNLANIPMCILWEICKAKVDIADLATYDPTKMYMYEFLCNCFIPIFLSAFNPVVIIACSTGFRCTLREWCKGNFSSYNSRASVMSRQGTGMALRNTQTQQATK